MKKSLLLSFILLLSLNAYCQFAITSSNLPTPGASFSISSLDTTGAVPGPSGAGQTWDFSSHTINSTSTINYVSAAGKPGASNFPLATVALQAGGSYLYYLANSSQYTTLGVYTDESGDSLVQSYTDNEINYTFPFNYGITQHDVFTGTTIESSAHDTTYRTGNDTATYDAYGTVKGPNGVNYTVARVKTIQNFYDSTDLGGLYEIQHSRTETYNYYQQNVQYPIISLSLYYVTYYFDGSTFSTTKNKTLAFYASGVVANTSSNAISAKTKIYPNPTNDQLNIELPDNDTYSLELKDMNGKSVLSSLNGDIIISGNKASSDLRRLSKGIYVLEINSNGKSGVKKIVVE
jgi:hypothetical protein